MSRSHGFRWTRTGVRFCGAQGFPGWPAACRRTFLSHFLEYTCTLLSTFLRHHGALSYVAFGARGFTTEVFIIIIIILARTTKCIAFTHRLLGPNLTTRATAFNAVQSGLTCEVSSNGQAGSTFCSIWLLQSCPRHHFIHNSILPYIY